MLINRCNQKVYIGQTIQKLEARLSRHKNASKKIKTKLYDSIRFYGWENFDKIRLDVAYSREDLDTLETFYIEKFQSIEFGLNLDEGGSNGLRSQETKEKISKGNSGKKRSPEQRERLSKSKKGKKPHINLFLGNKKYIETKKKKVLRVKTKEQFESIRECARKLGISYAALRNHLINKTNRLDKEIFVFV